MVTCTRKDLFVSKMSDIEAAGNLAENLALDLGFNQESTQEIIQAAAKMASELQKHAGQGTLSLSCVICNGQTGLRIGVKDNKPGLIQMRGQDHARPRTPDDNSMDVLGEGLDVVSRLVDDIIITTHGTNGTHVIARKWLSTKQDCTQIKPPNPFDLGGASRSFQGDRVNGDTFIIVHRPGFSLAATIDGLGHGKPAHEASTTVRDYIETHCAQSVPNLMSGAGRACRGTRGAVMALAKFDWQSLRVEYASIGNIECKFKHGPKELLLPVTRGVVGRGIDPVNQTFLQWTPGDIMIMHSDGIDQTWSFDLVRTQSQLSSHQIAKQILTHHGSDKDDATAMVIKSARGHV